MAFEIIQFPNLGLRLVPGVAYTKAELEMRCGRNKRKFQLLQQKMKDDSFFKPVDPSRALIQDSNIDDASTIEAAVRGARATTESEVEKAKKAAKYLRKPLTFEDQKTTKRRRIADSIAKSYLDGAAADEEPITDTKVLTVLRAWGFARNFNRQNILPSGQEWVHSDNLGLIRCRDGSVRAPLSRRFPNVSKLFVRWLRSQPSGAKFRCTSISVNKNYAAKRHRDSNNQGNSLVKAFGPFEEGTFRWFPKDDGKVPLESLSPEDAISANPREIPVVFDGRKAHEVDAFRGERYSLVFYVTKGISKATADTKRLARTHGFSW